MVTSRSETAPRRRPAHHRAGAAARSSVDSVAAAPFFSARSNSNYTGTRFNWSKCGFGSASVPALMNAAKENQVNVNGGKVERKNLHVRPSFGSHIKPKRMLRLSWVGCVVHVGRLAEDHRPRVRRGMAHRLYLPAGSVRSFSCTSRVKAIAVARSNVL